MTTAADESRIQGVTELVEGDLGTVPFRQLLFAYAVFRRSTTLELTSGQVWKRITFDTGAPVDCRSNLLQDTIGKFMVGRGDITEEQRQRCLAEQVSSKRRMGELMIEQGLITASELYRTLQQNLGKKLLDCFLWKQGTFRVIPTPEPNESSLRVNPAQLLYTGVTKLTSEADLRTAIEPFLGKTLIVSSAPQLADTDIRLKPDDRRLADGFRSGRTIEALAQDNGVPAEAVMRLAYGLLEVGLLVPAEAGRAASTLADVAPLIATPMTPGQELGEGSWAGIPDDFWQPPEMDPIAAASPAAVSGTQPPAAASVEDSAPPSLREDLMRVYIEFRKMDAFELLGLGDNATEQAIEGAYLERSWRFAPSRFSDAGLQDLGDKARELALAVGRAYGQLATTKGRAQAIARRRDRQASTPQRGAGASQGPSDLLDAEVLFRKGLRLLELGSTDSAIEQLQAAADAEPQNAMYKAELAWARYLSSPVGGARGALTALTEVVDRLDPRCGVAYLYRGQIQAALGHGQDAVRSLKMASRLLRNDPRPREALRDLQSKGFGVPREKKSVLSRILG